MKNYEIKWRCLTTRRLIIERVALSEPPKNGTRKEIDGLVYRVCGWGVVKPVGSQRAVRERPILFSGPMVRAILSGLKHQTRRIVKPQPERVARHVETIGTQPVTIPDGWQWRSLYTADEFMKDKHPAGFAANLVFHCPYGARGDRLWVRETWANLAHAGYEPVYVYRADGDTPLPPGVRWRPSIHMRRAACRLLLEVTDVRVERLQDISQLDAVAEGLTLHAGDQSIEDFADLWDDINGKRAPWDSNPWVWVVEFRRVAEQRQGTKGESE